MKIFAQQSFESEIADAMESFEASPFDQNAHDHQQALQLISQAIQDLNDAGQNKQANILNNALEALAKKCFRSAFAASSVISS